jgi:FkbM family methyltransferase
MDALAPIARVTQRLPPELGAKVGWQLGERASRRDRVAKLRNGARLVVDIGDYVHRPMYFVGEYEPGTTRLFERFARPGWTVLDVGANAGYFSVTAAALGAPGARVIAFEPNPRLTRMLSVSIELNREFDIRLEPVAVGNEPGALPFHLTSVERNSGLSSLRPDLPDTAGEVITVPVTTIDEYCATHALKPDLIKIDVEGFEQQVLQGSADTLSSARPRAVICEVAQTRDDPERLLQLMREHGYQAHVVGDDGSLRQLSLNPGAAFENICFTPGGGHPRTGP